jgi:hypothetical protein
MSLEPIDSNEFLPLRNEDERKQVQLLYAFSQKKMELLVLLEKLSKKPTLITLSIEAVDLEDSTRTRHSVQFVSNTNQLES